VNGGANLRDLKHALLTPINHILGFTEMQLEEAEESGLLDCVPAFTEIHGRGRTLLEIIEDEFAGSSANLEQLDARIESEAIPTLGLARGLADRLRLQGNVLAADDVDVVSGALDSLLALCRETARK
jgi:signal transduction histidine kinase